MSNVYFASDLHIGHKNIANFRAEVTGIKNCEENTIFILESWLGKISKRDTVYLLGDIFFHSDEMELFQDLPGKKVLILGNHDYQYSKYDIHRSYEFFDEVHGFHRLRPKGGNFWLSHCPIHTDELRGRLNIHGHCHYDEEPLKSDDRYINANMDVLLPKYGDIFLNLNDIRGGYR